MVTVEPRGDMYLPNQDGQKYLPVYLSTSISQLTLNSNGREVARPTVRFSVYL
jgi:hypothetical protein